jgi:2,5-diketo-D-gluconate reductase A
MAIIIGTDKLRGAECINVVKMSLDHGYRQIDTAQAYGNEEAIGEAIKQSSVSREELTITTKISAGWQKNPDTFEKAYESAKASLHRLGLSYVDTFLIHGPGENANDRYVTWQALEKLVEEGAIRRIGVCNFNVRQIVELMKIAKLYPPAVIQLEVSYILTSAILGI